MDRNSTTPDSTELFAGEAWFDPIEAGLRDRVRSFIGEMVEQELAAALGRERSRGAQTARATGMGHASGS
jgi:putative transposase